MINELTEKDIDMTSAKRTDSNNEIPLYKRKTTRFEKALMPLIGINLAMMVLLAVCLHITEIMGFDIPYMSINTITNLMLGLPVIMVLFVAVLMFSKKYGYAN